MYQNIIIMGLNSENLIGRWIYQNIIIMGLINEIQLADGYTKNIIIMGLNSENLIGRWIYQKNHNNGIK
jgi:hypothetical protein